MNWRGRSLVSHEVVVNLIANTTTRQGLKVRAELDTGHDPTGTKVPAKEINALCDTGRLTSHDFHGEWNYTIVSTPTNSRIT